MRERFWTLAFALALSVTEFIERRMLAEVRSRK